MGGHCQARVVKRPWSIRLSPFPDELLSSYLVRTAHAHGMHPMRFVSSNFPGAEVWTRDIDLSAPVPFLEEVASAAALSIDAVRSMTLASVISGQTCRQERGSALTTWITSVGMHGRSRTRNGLQFCPLCLQVNRVFLRTWRLTFAFACRIHRIMLEDHCRACGSPVVPHRSRCSTAICHRCGRPLEGSAGDKHDSVIDGALSVQERFLSYCESDRLSFAGTTVERTDFFAGLGMLLKIVREKMHSHPDVFDMEDQIVLDSHGSLRLLPSAIRLRLCARVFKIIDRWPEEFSKVARATGTTRVAFAHCGKAPAWLDEQVELLPQRLRRQHAYRRATLVTRVRQIEAAGGLFCRERRARELLNAARMWS